MDPESKPKTESTMHLRSEFKTPPKAESVSSCSSTLFSSSSSSSTTEKNTSLMWNKLKQYENHLENEIKKCFTSLSEKEKAELATKPLEIENGDDFVDYISLRTGGPVEFRNSRSVPSLYSGKNR